MHPTSFAGGAAAADEAEAQIMITRVKHEAVGLQMQHTNVSTKTPRCLARTACAINFEVNQAEEKKTWEIFWIWTDKYLDLEDSVLLEVEDGNMDV